VAADAAGDLLSTLGADTTIAGVGRCRGKVWDVFGEWVAGTDVGHAYVGGFAGFAEGVIARVEVFTFLVNL
jgi:hypothetical protein